MDDCESYLAESFRLGVLFKAESWKMDTRPEDLCLCQDADTAHAVNIHLHVWVAVRVS